MIFFIHNISSLVIQLDNLRIFTGRHSRGEHKEARDKHVSRTIRATHYNCNTLTAQLLPVDPPELTTWEAQSFRSCQLIRDMACDEGNRTHDPLMSEVIGEPGQNIGIAQLGKK